MLKGLWFSEVLIVQLGKKIAQSYLFRFCYILTQYLEVPKGSACLPAIN